MDIDISGAFNGALNPDSDDAQKHADQYYVSVRKMKTDISRIANNTGYEMEKVLKIKEHLFLKKHSLGGSEPEYFYPNYHISQSWQRLIDGGNILAQDYMLLEHEYLEQELMSEGLPQDKAHEMASKEFNYRKSIEGKE
jgi:hypothetical protein